MVALLEKHNLGIIYKYSSLLKIKIYFKSFYLEFNIKVKN